jgi:hypothetical protein
MTKDPLPGICLPIEDSDLLSIQVIAESCAKSKETLCHFVSLVTFWHLYLTLSTSIGHLKASVGAFISPYQDAASLCQA